MKKKGARDVPDFSSHRPVAPRAGMPQPKPAPVRAPAPQQTVKPQATNAKSGRRGQ